MKVAALIPAYCEERFIADVALRVRAQLADVLVVDDGSNDATGPKARGTGVEVITHERNRGKGAAIQTGLRALLVDRDFDYAIILDGDGQHLPEEIPRFLEAAGREGNKLLVGNRMNETRGMPIHRLLTNRFMSSQISLLCGQKVRDTQCGFRMIHRLLAPTLLGRTAGFDYETEMLILASWAGERISSVPISTVYGEETSSINPTRDAQRFLALMARYWGKRIRRKAEGGTRNPIKAEDNKDRLTRVCSPFRFRLPPSAFRLRSPGVATDPWCARCRPAGCPRPRRRRSTARTADGAIPGAPPPRVRP